MSCKSLFFVTIPYFCLQGVYKPRIRCYDTSELCMKFERCLDSESKLCAHSFYIISSCYSSGFFL